MDGADMRLLIGQHVPLLRRGAEEQANLHAHRTDPTTGDNWRAAREQIEKAIRHSLFPCIVSDTTYWNGWSTWFIACGSVVLHDYFLSDFLRSPRAKNQKG